MIEPDNDPSVVTEEDHMMANHPHVRNCSTQSYSPEAPQREYGNNFYMSNMPACKWGDDQTVYYRIRRRPCEATDFIGLPGTKFRKIQWHRPEYADFLRYATPEELHPKNAGQDKVRELLLLLKSIQMRDPSVPLRKSKTDYSGQESLTDQAIKILFQLLGMEQEGCTFVRTSNSIVLHQQGTFSRVTVDAAVVDELHTLYLLLITEHKPWDANRTPFGQLMAGAIAAFQYNNTIRNGLGQPKLNLMIFPGVIWIGSMPSFYRIKVTQELADAVQYGNRPEHDTWVAQYQPPIEDEWRGYGLWRPRNRPIVLKILENMKDFLPSRYNHIPDGWYRFMSKEETEHIEQVLLESSGQVHDKDSGKVFAGLEDVIPDNMSF